MPIEVYKKAGVQDSGNILFIFRASYIRVSTLAMQSEQIYVSCSLEILVINSTAYNYIVEVSHKFGYSSR